MEHKGTVMGYALGNHRQINKQAIIIVPGTTPKEAKALVGATVAWPYDAPTIKGTITKPLGNSGHLTATFKRCLPGTSIGTPIKITKE